MLNAPDHLPPAALDVFKALATQVANSNAAMPAQLLTDLLAQYAAAHAARELATRELAAAGTLFAVSPNGVKYAHPAFRVIDQTERTMDRVLRRLGHGSGKTDHALPTLNLDDD